MYCFSYSKEVLVSWGGTRGLMCWPYYSTELLVSWDRTRWVNVLLLLVYRDAGELGGTRGSGAVMCWFSYSTEVLVSWGGTRG